MNYLAHIYLAQHSGDAQLGALLGDFVKGDARKGFHLDIAREIHIHRKIDQYTDQHPIVRQARNYFAIERRRFAGILLDIYYDHVLAKNWSTYSDLELDRFIADFYKKMLARRQFFTATLDLLVPRMIEQDWLGSYQNRDGVNIATHRVSSRLSKNGHLLRECLLDLERHEQVIELGFHEFFPQLQTFVADLRGNLS
ncbi:ACP phosphodiesterase [Undibacterium fentianense]|uniref:DUF479 domain-containing protein n=1 Tax=Undibacterium fentianense TaxID=2828728 RepID=A0A941E321_9BURK|nr:ACP phosphodiesterase [Undibacterium fentianense]MBR7800157.1 DUF479 domain-containing protein [Undibacterium fentianense]